jgi:hypothetical protein
MDERRGFGETAQEKNGRCDEAEQDSEVVRHHKIVYGGPGCHGRCAGQRARHVKSPSLWETPAYKHVQTQPFSSSTSTSLDAGSVAMAHFSVGDNDLASSLSPGAAH